MCSQIPPCTKNLDLGSTPTAREQEPARLESNSTSPRKTDTQGAAHSKKLFFSFKLGGRIPQEEIRLLTKF